MMLKSLRMNCAGAALISMMVELIHIHLSQWMTGHTLLAVQIEKDV